MSNWHKHREFADEASAHGPYRGNCPFCGGRGTFTATQEYGTLKYNCYKLGCDVGGVFDTDMTAAEIRKHMIVAPVEPEKEKETMEIPVYVVQPNNLHDKFNRFIRRHGIAVRGLMYDVKDERVVFPILHEGRTIDAIGRAVGKKKHPKWYRYTGAADYYIIGSGKSLLIVEDVISAIIAYQELPNVTAMAILGTQLTDKHMEKIGEYDHVIVALDPDAADKTLKYKREIEEWTGTKSFAMRLDDDIKYRVDADIEKLTELTSD